MKNISYLLLLLFLCSCATSSNSIAFHSDPEWPVQPVVKSTHGAYEYDKSDLQQHVALDKSLGVKLVRAGVPWNQLEPEPDTYNFTWTDQYVNALNKEGIGTIMVISMSPEWANGNPDGDYVPTDENTFNHWIEDYAQFVVETVRHFKGRVHYWELWNEPNMYRFWLPKPSADQYCRWANKMYEVIKMVDPDAIILWGGGVTSWNTQNDDRVFGKDFFDKVVKCSPADAMDYSTHAYGGASEVMQARNILDRNGRKSARLHVTEFGKRTKNDAEQLQWYKSFLNSISKYGFGVASLTAFWDYDRPNNTIDEGNPIDNYSLIREDGTLRPAGEFYRDYQFLYGY